MLAGFPASLFVTLAGVTLLFSLAEENGTIGLLSNRLVRAARGSVRAIPLLLFCIAGIVSMLGPGAIASVALVAPLAMAIGARTGVPAFLTALMVANGANAGNLSPLSAIGVIANTRMAAAGLGGHEWKVFAANFLAHVLVAGVAFLALVPRPRDGAVAGQIDGRRSPRTRPTQDPRRGACVDCGRRLRSARRSASPRSRHPWRSSCSAAQTKPKRSVKCHGPPS